MALASRGNCSLSNVKRTAENNSTFSSSSAECEEGDCSICRSGQASPEKLKQGERVGHVYSFKCWSSGA